MHLEWAISRFQCSPASSACFFIFLSNLFRFGYLYTFFSTTQNQRVQINSEQIAQKKINNIKHLLRLRLTKISLKVCNWQSFGEKLLWHSVQGENIIITFGCAFVQEKYLITEFMHVSSSAQILSWLLLCVFVWFDSRKYGTFEQFGKMHSPWVRLHFSMSWCERANFTSRSHSSVLPVRVCILRWVVANVVLQI